MVIGRNNVIREGVTMHVGTPKGGGCTRVGDDNLIMNGAHIAHDCQIGSHCIIASFSGLAGHVSVGDHDAFQSDEWIHLAASWTGPLMCLYVNGEHVGTIISKGGGDV